MTNFWILLSGLIGLALLFVITPLLSRRETVPDQDQDQDQLNLQVFRQQLQELDADLLADNLDQTQYKAARRDLERELLYDVDEDSSSADATKHGGRLMASLLAIALPASAIALYLDIGNRAIIPRLEAVAAGQPATPAGGHPARDGGGMPPLDLLVQRLAEKMEQNPDNLEGWLMLGRTYLAVSQPEKALKALEQAYGLAPENADVIIAYAQAAASNADGKLAGRPAELIGTALEIDPTNATARWLNGLLAYQQGDFAAAVARWQAVLAELEPSGDEAAELREFISDARQRGGLEPLEPETDTVAAIEESAAPPAGVEPSATQTTATTGAVTGPSIEVNVALDESLWSKADVKSTLFVYAKAVTGPPMPLAVKRLSVGALPVTVTLDDSMAMMPTMRLSNFPEVTVGARISKSGQAMPESGDLEGEISPVKIGAAGALNLIIDRVRP